MCIYIYVCIHTGEKGRQRASERERHRLTETESKVVRAAKVDKVNDCGDTALHAAAWQGHVDAVEQLVVARAIISGPSKFILEFPSNGETKARARLVVG